MVQVLILGISEILMPRPPNILRPIRLHTCFPEDLRAQMDLHLFSEVEGRVPHGAYQQFLIGLVKEFFDGKAATAESVILEAIVKAIHQLSSAMGSPAIQGSIHEPIEVAVINEAIRRFRV